MNELRQWFAAQPFTTKWLTVLSLVFPLLLKFRILSWHWVGWEWEHITHKFQLWRAVTPVFLTKVSFNFLISLYFRFQYSFYLETGVFAGRSADYLYFLSLSILLMNVMNYFIGMAVLWESFSMVIVYVWAKYNGEVIVNFMFGFRFPAMYLPLVLALMDFVMAGDFYGPLVGIVVGHLYYFLAEVYVRKDPRWRARLRAPAWLQAMVPKYQAPVAESHAGFTVHRPEDSFRGKAAEPGFRPFGGRGQKLGQ